MQFARFLPVFALVIPTHAALARTARDSVRPLDRCDGRTVTAIDIEPAAPAIIGDSASAFRRTVFSVALQHVTTKTSVVQAFLLLERGGQCTERRRAESERILRAQPFIAEASVRAFPDGAHGTRITVRTVDEIPAVVSGSVRGNGLSAVTFGNANLFGQGLYVAGRWKQGFAYRDGIGVRVVDYHAFGRPYTFSLLAERAPRGTNVGVALGHSFLTNLQQTAWHVGYSDVSSYVSFMRPVGDGLSLNTDRQLWDVGAVWRTGLVNKRTFVGAVLTHERAMPAARGVIISDSGFVADTTGTLDGRFGEYESLRLAGVFGIRLLSFMQARGFDALTAEQDVAKGVQIGATVGRGIPRMGTHDRANFFSGDVYAGVGTPGSFIGLRVEGEGREDRTTKRWDAIVASGRVAWYLKPSAAQTVIASGEYSGAWRSRLPFQLRLGDREAGVRGYDGAFIAGGQRAVARLEGRWAMGTLTKHAGVGAAAFVDAGRVWAGGVPFGQNSGMRTSVGIGLLAAVPRHSQRLLRVDLAVPLSSAPGVGKWQVLFSVGSAARMFWQEPSDIARVRTGAPPSGIFSWP